MFSIYTESQIIRNFHFKVIPEIVDVIVRRLNVSFQEHLKLFENMFVMIIFKDYCWLLLISKKKILQIIVK